MRATDATHRWRDYTSCRSHSTTKCVSRIFEGQPRRDNFVDKHRQGNSNGSSTSATQLFPDNNPMNSVFTGESYMVADASGSTGQRITRGILNGASFVISTGEAVLGAGLMITGAGFPLGAVLAAHGTYGMANSARGMYVALYNTEATGLGEYIGNSLAGENGARTGRILDYASGLAGGINGIGKLGQSASPRIGDAIKGITDIGGAADTLNNMSTEGRYRGMPKEYLLSIALIIFFTWIIWSCIKNYLKKY